MTSKKMGLLFGILISITTVGIAARAEDGTIEFHQPDVITYSEGTPYEYTFVAPASGIYGVELYDKIPNIWVETRIYDEYDNEVQFLLCDGNDVNDYVTFGAQEGTEYKIVTKTVQDNEYSGFSINLYYPHEIADINGYSLVKDELTFRGGENRYKFTCPVSGEYIFKFTDQKTLNAEFEMSIQETTGQEIIEISPDYFDPEYDMVSLKEGITYNIVVFSYAKDNGQYEVAIEYPDGFTPQPTVEANDANENGSADVSEEEVDAESELSLEERVERLENLVAELQSKIE